MLSALQTSSEKLEEMLKGLYPTKNETKLDNIEHKYSAIKFFEKLLKLDISSEHYIIGERKELETLLNISPNEKNWIEYIIELKTFKKGDWNGMAETLDYNSEKLGGSGWGFFITPLEDDDKESINSRNKEFNELYENGIKKLSKKEREEVIKKFLK
jgi:hypothetical protein